MKIKRWSVVMVGVILALVWLAADTAVAQDRRFAGTTLNIAVQPDVFAGPIRRLLPRFEEETGIKVNMQTIPYASLREKQILDFTSKTGNFDVVTMDIVWMGEYAEAGWIVPLEPYIKKDAATVQLEDLLPGAMEGLAQWKGKIYGLPIGAYYYFLAYRSDLFKAAGVTPPETLDDLKAAVRRLHNPSGGVYGFSAGYRRGAPVVHDSMAYLTGLGGALFKDFPNNLKPQLNSASGLATYNFYKEMLQYAPPGAITFDFQARREPFQQGRIALLGNWTSSFAAFEDPKQSVEVTVKNVQYTFLPRPAKGAKPVVPFGGWSLVINNFSTKKDASWELIKWMTSPRIQKIYVADGGTAIRFSSLKDPELAGAKKWFALILDAEAKGYVRAHFRPRIPEWAKMEEVMGLHLSEAMAGERPVAEALQQIDQKIEDLVRKAGYPVQ